MGVSVGRYPLPRIGEDRPRLVLCAVNDALAQAWSAIVDHDEQFGAHRGSILEVGADAVVSPANSGGWMRGGIDAVYADELVGIEDRVRSAVLALHGGELPVGQALVVPTGTIAPTWLISAPTMREPGERLAAGSVHPYLAARAVFRLWLHGRLEDGTALRSVVGTIALPGLGTGVGGVGAGDCARQVVAAWDEVFADSPTLTPRRASQG
ncbi:MAG: macro domain-containing protein [Sciscionella sp.]